MNSLNDHILDSPAVSSAELEALVQHARSDGVDTQAILARYGLSSNGLHRHTTSIGLVDYFKIERDIARSLDDLTARLSTRKLTYRTGDFVVRQIGKSPTLAQAITQLCDYFNMMHGGEYNTVHEGTKTITINIDDHKFPYAIGDFPDYVLFIGECVQIKVHCLLDSISSGLAARALQRVGVVREAPRSQPDHMKFWSRAPLAGQPVYSLTYDLKLAQQVIQTPDGLNLSSTGILSHVISQLEKTTIAHRFVRIHERVIALFEDGLTDQEQIAGTLNTSVATMRRRLSENGTSFRQLLSDYRIQVAENRLQRDCSILQISDELGYSDIRAFNRAFKRMKGITPFEYSRRLKDKG